MISLFNLVLMASCLAVTHGMKCYIGEETLVNQLTHLSCPRPILDDSAKSYCCIDTNGEFYCCNFFEFASLYIIIAVVIIVVLSIVCSIIFCFCCPCCFFYKRRHAGNGGPSSKPMRKSEPVTLGGSRDFPDSDFLSSKFLLLRNSSLKQRTGSSRLLT